MDIGTAKPDAATRARVPHHLIDILDPVEAYSAARFRARRASTRLPRSARAARAARSSAGRCCTSRRCAKGSSALPPADPAVRARLDARAAAEGWPALHAELARVDPATASALEAPPMRSASSARSEVSRGRRARRYRSCRARARRRGRLGPTIADRARAAGSRAAASRRSRERFDAMLASGPRRRARGACARAMRCSPRHAVDALRRLPAGVGRFWTARSMRATLRARGDRRHAPAREAPVHLASRDAGGCVRLASHAAIVTLTGCADRR